MRSPLLGIVNALCIVGMLYAILFVLAAWWLG